MTRVLPAGDVAVAAVPGRGRRPYRGRVPVPYVPPSDDGTPAADAPAAAPALRGVFGELPPAPVFGAAVEPVPGADAWTPRVTAPLRPSTPRWYRANPHAFRWAAAWSLVPAVVGAALAARADAVSAYLLGGLVGSWLVSTLLVGVVAHRSDERWRWWLGYPGGVLLVACLRIAVGAVTGR